MNTVQIVVYVYMYIPKCIFRGHLERCFLHNIKCKQKWSWMLIACIFCRRKKIIYKFLFVNLCPNDVAMEIQKKKPFNIKVTSVT